METRPSFLKLAAVAVALLLVASAGLWWLKIHEFSPRLAIDDGIGLLRDAGPWAFFTAMALLPAFGCPLLVFSLTAASAFGERLGLAGVIAAAGVAILVNLILTYWLARYAFRPTLVQLIGLTKYKIPVVPAADQAEIILLARITPGPPFFLQSYLLGLAEIPFVSYLWISWVVSMAYAVGFVLFGDAILHGKAKMAVMGLSALVAVALIVHVLRKHYGKKGA